MIEAFKAVEAAARVVDGFDLPKNEESTRTQFLSSAGRMAGLLNVLSRMPFLVADEEGRNEPPPSLLKDEESHTQDFQQTDCVPCREDTETGRSGQVDVEIRRS
jgi:hypothetical protein